MGNESMTNDKHENNDPMISSYSRYMAMQSLLSVGSLLSMGLLLSMGMWMKLTGTNQTEAAIATDLLIPERLRSVDATDFDGCFFKLHATKMLHNVWR